MIIKTRFSPSPTGELHCGGARTALYNWLFAKINNGKFILRIEDTDLKRSKKLYIDNIINSLKWLNISWDEGPYFQTQRLNRYKKFIDIMLNNGSAYKCYCSKDRLLELRKKQIQQGIKPKYDRYCLNNNNKFINNNYVIRFKNFINESVSFYDQIRGLIKIKNNELDDLIICRSNGIPTYNFCVVIDDYDMQITHIIRGEEHINNTPRQINILKSIGAKIPSYTHVSMILDDHGKKMSKRYDNSKSIMQYYKNGFLPEAMINHLLRLGWSYGNKEIFDIEEMKKLFNIKNLNKSSCKFNTKKLIWLNHHYIKKTENYEILKKIKHYIEIKKINKFEYINEILNILKKRCKSLKEIAQYLESFFEATKNFNNENIKKYNDKKYISLLKNILTIFNNVKIWSKKEIKFNIESIILTFENEINKKNIFNLLKILVAGNKQFPELYTLIYILGKKYFIEKTKFCIKYFSK